MRRHDVMAVYGYSAVVVIHACRPRVCYDTMPCAVLAVVQWLSKTFWVGAGTPVLPAAVRTARAL
jgi:hypothetical protein